MAKKLSKKQISTIITSIIFILFIIFDISPDSISFNSNNTNQNSAIAKIKGAQSWKNALDEKAATNTKQQNGLFKVSRVIDGDTIELETGEKIRYIGINAPETKHPRKKLSATAKKPVIKIKSL